MRLFLLMAVFLAGCTTPGQEQARRPSSADDPTYACFRTRLEDPRLAVLIPKVGSLGRADAGNVELLTSKERPTDQEKSALKLWVEIRQACLDAGREFRARYAPPGWDSAVSSSQTKLILLTARLFAAEITYGDFNRERRSIASETDTAIRQVNERSMEAQRAEDEQRRAAAMQMLQNMQIQQQLNRPITTTCGTLYGQTTCTTR